MLADKFNLSSDFQDDLKLESSIEVSLICPLSKKRIEIPARANTCNYIFVIYLKNSFAKKSFHIKVRI